MIVALVGERRSADPLGGLVAEDSRPLAARLAYAPADHYRPLRVMRGVEEGRPLPIQAVARLEEAGDYQGVAAAYLLLSSASRVKVNPAAIMRPARVPIIRGMRGHALWLPSIRAYHPDVVLSRRI